MTAHLIKRGPLRTAPHLRFFGELELAHARVHELCGDARRALALMIGQASKGSIFWVRPAWGMDGLHGPGLVRYIDPARLTFVDAAREEDILWSMEEILRSGNVPLCVAEIATPPALTPVRRLHLAARAGADAQGGKGPIGLLLCPGDGGAQGVESRWRMTARDGGGKAASWNLWRTRARINPQKQWTVVEERSGHPTLHEASER